MGNIQVDEAVHNRAVERAGRVDVLEQENAAKDTRIKELEEAAATRDRTDRATAIIGARAEEAGVEFTPREIKGFLADIVVKEDGTLDEAAFTTLVDEDAAAKKAAGGSGTVRGFGSDNTPIGEDEDITPVDVDKSIGEAFGRAPAMAGTQVKEA